MKKILSTIILVLILSAPIFLFAQNPPHPNGGSAPGSGSIPVGGGAPVDGGIGLLIFSGLAYAMIKRKKPESEIPPSLQPKEDI